MDTSTVYKTGIELAEKKARDKYINSFRNENEISTLRLKKHATGRCSYLKFKRNDRSQET